MSKVGLTPDSGKTNEIQELRTLTAPVASRYNDAMQDFKQLADTTSPQHKRFN
ncbi:hypothetical protein DPMN_169353 [Dreissena polymorpha]|uniref:Uncharacterized protein n=1 Tax=Dreissena polymorpha TaxID=45954 RepID=A0A9D4IAJ8_DREPO|nr:hypothetical protein DPMN_169353 [Dreissena polymorpha]